MVPAGKSNCLKYVTFISGVFKRISQTKNALRGWKNIVGNKTFNALQWQSGSVLFCVFGPETEGRSDLSISPALRGTGDNKFPYMKYF
jgi:hypothetical protein